MRLMSYNSGSQQAASRCRLPRILTEQDNLKCSVIHVGTSRREQPTVQPSSPGSFLLFLGINPFTHQTSAFANSQSLLRHSSKVELLLLPAYTVAHRDTVAHSTNYIVGQHPGHITMKLFPPFAVSKGAHCSATACEK